MTDAASWERGRSAVEVVRRVCLAFPEVEERPSHGTPAFFVRGKKAFVYAWGGGHHDDDFPHLWTAAPAGAQEELVEREPERFFRPAYVGHRGWIGVRLDRDLDDTELAEICREAYRTIAPPTLVKQLDA